MKVGKVGGSYVNRKIEAPGALPGNRGGVKSLYGGVSMKHAITGGMSKK